MTISLENFWLEEIVDKSKLVGHTKVDPEKFRASMLPYCNRKILYRRDIERQPEERIFLEIEDTDYVQKNNNVILGKNIAGQAIHEFIQNLVSDSKQVIAIEPYVEADIDGFSVEGHIDLLLQLDEITIVDIKTFERNDKYDITNYLPNEHHKDQLAIYSLITGIKNCQLLYINRSNLEPLYFSINKNELQQRKEKLKTKIRLLAKAEYDKKLPEIIPLEMKYEKEQLNWECKYCEFVNLCHP